MEFINRPYSLLKAPEDRQASHRDQDPTRFANNSMLQHQNSLSSEPINNTSFRVENRRAKPKIIKNPADRGNIFFVKQSSNVNSQQKQHRRQIASQGAEFSLQSAND